MIRTTTINNMIEGFIGNMSETQIDEELRFFGKLARKLGCARTEYGHFGVIIDEDWEIDSDMIDGMEENLGYRPYDEKNEPSGFQFLYFRNEEDAEHCREWIEERKAQEA